MPEITDFAVKADRFTLRIDCALDGAAVLGCHWVDPVSGRFLKESPWVETNGANRGAIEIEVPRAPGLYRFFVSPKNGDGQWGYLKGERFLAIDARVDDAGISVARQILTRAGSLRRERWPGVLREIFAGPFVSIWSNRQLILSMVRRDILSRYRGSFADAFWAILSPLLLMLTYYFVFGVVLKTPSPDDTSKYGYLYFFLAGMLPWLAMNESIARSPNTALEHRNLITKLIFPVEILPVNLTLAGMVTGVTASGLYLLFLIATKGLPPTTALLLPALWLPQFLLTAGLCYLLAAASVYVRDLVYMIGLLLTIWFFLTPICYAANQLPQDLNPLFILVSAYRAILNKGLSPDWPAIGKLYAFAIALFYAGFAVFRTARKGFADVL